MTIIGCCVSGMIKSAMITECWTPQTSHRDTVFSIYLVSTATVKQAVLKNTMETKNCIYMHTIEEIIDPPPSGGLL